MIFNKLNLILDREIESQEALTKDCIESAQYSQQKYVLWKTRDEISSMILHNEADAIDQSVQPQTLEVINNGVSEGMSEIADSATSKKFL